MKQIYVYTDGGCDPNPGYGAAAALLTFTDDKGRRHDKLVSMTENQSTNNRAEIMAALVAVQAMTQPCEVFLYSDSRYLVETMCGRWSKSSNLDLWKLLDQAVMDGGHKITWTWVRGHDGNPGNVRCHNEVTRLLQIHAANDLLNTGERLSDDAWFDQRAAERKGRGE